MKAQSVPIWQYIGLLVTFLILAISVQPLGAAADFAEKNNARLESQEIAGIINYIKSSPSATFVFKKPLPLKCENITITEKFINLTVDRKTSFVMGITQTPVKLKPVMIDCKKTRAISIEKDSNMIEVK